MVVLCYVHNVSTRCEIFVANRLNVSVKYKSRGMQPCQASDADLRLKVPKFLMLSVSE